MSYRDIAILPATAPLAKSTSRLRSRSRLGASVLAIGLLAQPAFADDVSRTQGEPIIVPSARATIPDRSLRGSLNAGFNAASGDVKAYDLMFNGDARWATETDKVTGTASFARGNKRDANDKSSVTAHHMRGLVQYDHDLSPVIYTLAFLELERAKLRNLALRSTVGVGLGKHVIRNADMTFDVFGGVSYTYEKYLKSAKHPAVQRRYPELVLGESLTYRLSPSTHLTQRFAIYPNLNRMSEFRTQLDVGVATALSKRLQLKATLTNSYYNTPPAGGKKMNTTLTTTLGYIFGPL